MPPRHHHPGQATAAAAAPLPAEAALGLALRHIPLAALPHDVEESLQLYLDESGIKAKHARQQALELTDGLKALSRCAARRPPPASRRHSCFLPPAARPTCSRERSGP